MIQAYLRYWLAARDEHSLHSPFLYDLYTRTIRVDDREAPVYTPIAQVRQQLCSNPTQIHVTDFGTGAGQYHRSVSSIARKSLKADKYGRLLHRLTQRFQTRTVLDLGTSLGVTTAYLAKGAEAVGGQVVTFEGCPETADLAGQTFAQLGCTNVRQVVGNLDQTLAPALAQLPSVDLVFFDANHRYTPTIQYFKACLERIHNDSVFVFDDIHWSAEMEQAWQTIREHPAVTVSVDLFALGLVFFRREQPRQHFVLRF